MDEYVYTNIYYPTASASWFGTAAAGSATQTKEFVMLQQQADYTRTPLLTITCASGTITSGTCYLTGTDQFGYAQTEEISALGTSGVTRAGTKIFKTISAGSLVLANTGAQGTALATATLGAAIGTAANQVARFGLGYKVGAASDVKMVSWINNGTATGITAGTVISTLVSATTHSFAGTKIVAATDVYTVQAIPTYNAEAETKNVCS